MPIAPITALQMLTLLLAVFGSLILVSNWSNSTLDIFVKGQMVLFDDNRISRSDFGIENQLSGVFGEAIDGNQLVKKMLSSIDSQSAGGFCGLNSISYLTASISGFIQLRETV